MEKTVTNSINTAKQKLIQTSTSATNTTVQNERRNNRHIMKQFKLQRVSMKLSKMAHLRKIS